MALKIQVVIDAADPARLAQFWAAALGYRLDKPPPPHGTWESYLEANGVPRSEWNNFSAVTDPDGQGPRFFFQRVPEPKVVKNRVHVDLNISGGGATPLAERRPLVDAEVERIETLGGAVLRPMQERGEYWVVMQDPEGNEFCVH